MRFIYLVAIAFCAFLVGCDQATLMKKFIPPEEESIAKGYVELLQQGKFDQIEHDLDSSPHGLQRPEHTLQNGRFLPC
jgi:hypothetical protein